MILEASRPPGYQKRYLGLPEISAFWRHLGDPGRHLVSSWPPRGPQNQQFGRQGFSKCQKMRSQKGYQKTHRFVMGSSWEGVRFYRCRTHPNALYISISVVSADYDKSRISWKSMPKLAPKVTPKSIFGHSWI